jgi:hypothetical protein
MHSGSKLLTEHYKCQSLSQSGSAKQTLGTTSIEPRKMVNHLNDKNGKDQSIKIFFKEQLRFGILDITKNWWRELKIAKSNSQKRSKQIFNFYYICFFELKMTRLDFLKRTIYSKFVNFCCRACARTLTILWSSKFYSIVESRKIFFTKKKILEQKNWVADKASIQH